MKGGEILEHAHYEIIVEESTPFYGRIAVEPLERGYGVTLGNALRRVLLSSITGAAITAVRVDGVLHEFSTVPGVKEDMIELLMNIKHIPVRCFAPEHKILQLDVEPSDEARAITAKFIEADSDVEFPDPEALICSLEAGKSLHMEFYIESGVGYAQIDRPRPSYLPVDALLVDAIFSPAKRVKYEVSDKRMGQRTDYDRLLLEVWTNGVVKPEDAVRQASVILKDYFLSVAVALSHGDQEVIAEIKGIDPSAASTSHDGDHSAANFSNWDNPDYRRPIRELELSVRSENCLMRGGVQCIGELVTLSRADLLKIRNLGKVSLKEIEEKLTKFSLSLSGEIDEDADDEQY